MNRRGAETQRRTEADEGRWSTVFNRWSPAFWLRPVAALWSSA